MNFLRFIISVFYPNKCITCNALIDEDVFLCERCEKRYKPGPSSKIGNKHLKSCAYSFYYEGDIKMAIWKFKFRRKLSYGSAFSEYMFDCYNEYYFSGSIDYLIPVPMTPKKQRKRGYNQTIELANKLSDKTGIPTINNGLIKVRENSNQHLSSFKERKLNVKGVYKANKDIDFKGKNVIIIDDVLTTGLTMFECAKELKKAGADSVYGITIASSSEKALVNK